MSVTTRPQLQLLLSLLVGLLVLLHPNANINNRHFALFDCSSPLNKSKLRSAEVFTGEFPEFDNVGREKLASLKKPTNHHPDDSNLLLLTDHFRLSLSLHSIPALITDTPLDCSAHARLSVSRAPPQLTSLLAL